MSLCSYHSSLDNLNFKTVRVLANTTSPLSKSSTPSPRWSPHGVQLVNQRKPIIIVALIGQLYLSLKCNNNGTSILFHCTKLCSTWWWRCTNFLFLFLKLGSGFFFGWMGAKRPKIKESSKIIRGGIRTLKILFEKRE